MRTLETSPKRIFNKISQHVVGQLEAKKTISTALYLHIIKSFNHYHGGEYGPKSNTLLVGPTGVGKTHILRAIEKTMPELNLLKVNAMSITQKGWQGDCIEELIIDWQKNCNDKYGIVFIDEVDKICTPDIGSGGSDHNKATQQSLLALIEGCDIHSNHGRANQTFNTSNLMFILGGNFQEKRDSDAKEKDKMAIGFMPKTEEKLDQKALHKKISRWGMIPELVGRISNISELEALDKKTLKKIFTSKNGPYEHYKTIYKCLGKELDLSEYISNKLIEECVEDGTGARGLQSALDRHLNSELYEVENMEVKFGRLDVPEKENLHKYGDVVNALNIDLDALIGGMTISPETVDDFNEEANRIRPGVPTEVKSYLTKQGMPIEIVDLWHVFDNGAAKHGAMSWLKPDNKSLNKQNNVDSMRRHLEKYESGLNYDNESGIHHLLHLASRAIMRYTREARGIKDTDE